MLCLLFLWQLESVNAAFRICACAPQVIAVDMDRRDITVQLKMPYRGPVPIIDNQIDTFIDRQHIILEFMAGIDYIDITVICGNTAKPVFRIRP